MGTKFIENTAGKSGCSTYLYQRIENSAKQIRLRIIFSFSITPLSIILHFVPCTQVSPP